MGLTETQPNMGVCGDLTCMRLGSWGLWDLSDNGCGRCSGRHCRQSRTCLHQHIWPCGHSHARLRVRTMRRSHLSAPRGVGLVGSQRRRVWWWSLFRPALLPHPSRRMCRYYDARSLRRMINVMLAAHLSAGRSLRLEESERGRVCGVQEDMCPPVGCASTRLLVLASVDIRRGHRSRSYLHEAQAEDQVVVCDSGSAWMTCSSRSRSHRSHSLGLLRIRSRHKAEWADRDRRWRKRPAPPSEQGLHRCEKESRREVRT
jgi:hypothetical protein